MLDLGCGSGIPMAQMLAAEGFSLHGVDGSEALLAHARTVVPGVTFECAAIESWTPAETYAGILFWDVLFHLPRDLHGPLLVRLREALEPGGLLLLTSGGCTEDIAPFTDFMFGVEFHYDGWPVAAFVELCEKSGYRVLRQVQLNEPDGGRDKGRMGLLLRRG